MRSDAVHRVIRAYDDWIVRAYCWGRFGILRQRFLDEIGQYLPERGRVLDVGCGFGLFSLYYASVHPALTVEGFDRNARRIALARAAAGRLGLGNVRYEVGDVMDFRGGEHFDAAYMLDIVHHIPEDAVRPLLEQEQGRLFLFSDVPYYRGRAAYQLLPLNVFHDLRAPKPPSAASFRKGDVLVLFQQRGVAFNAAESRVRWTDGQTLDVTPLLVAGGNAVFRVR